MKRELTCVTWADMPFSGTETGFLQREGGNIMRREWRKEKGSALVIAMCLTVFLMGLVAVALVMMNRSARDVTEKERQGKALDAAEVGYHQFLKESRVKADYDAETGEFSAIFGEPLQGDTTGEYRAFNGEMNGMSYSVTTRSSYQAWKNFHAGTTPEPIGLPREVTFDERNSLSKSTFDILDVLAETRITDEDSGVPYIRKVAATVELAKEPIQIPGALYLEEGTQNLIGSDYRISGEDHEKDPKAVYPDYCLKMPFPGRLKAVFVYSEAGLDSGFWMVDPATGMDKMLIPSNHPRTEADRTSYTTEFAEGQELIFFGRIEGRNYGVESYDHYMVGHIDPWHSVAYGCISLYKLKAGVSIDGLSASEAEVVLSNNNNYELLKDATGKTYYKRLDLKATDFNNPDIRRVTYGLEDLKGKQGKYYTVDWDHDDIVVDIYLMPTLTETGDVTDLTYTVVRDQANQVKFENAPVGLGENGAEQTDQFVIETAGEASSVSVETKAGRGVALNYIGEEVTDSNGFTVRLLAHEGNKYTFGCTSDSSTWTAALSHIEFTFNGTNVVSPGSGSYKVPRVSGSLEYIAGISTLYELSSRPNEYDYLTNKTEYAVAAVTYEGEYTDFGFATYNAGVLVTVNEKGERVTGANAVDKGSVNVDAVANAYLKSNGIEVTEVTELIDGELGSNEEYKLIHAKGDLTVAAEVNVAGGGVLVVDGNLTVYGKLDWTGIIIVRGNLIMDPTMSGKHNFVRGSVLVKGTATIDGKVDIWYSRDAVQKTLADLDPEMMIVPNPLAWREVK